MRQLFIAIFLLSCSSLMAQTKEIAFKSHSGNMNNFSIALGSELFDSGESNFGLPAPTDLKTYKLDSVIYVSDTVSVIVIKEYRRQPLQPKDSAKLWRTGKDTLYNDPMLGRKHSLDSIKTVLKITGNYINPVDRIVFIGYDNKKNKDNKNQKNNILPVSFTGDDNNNSPFDMKLLLMLGTILVLSLFGGWLSWKFHQPRLQKA
ncbi:MAG: hypothetical protein LH619_09610 [Chitinophagaceae bacterium]|nr:hypothetical protein [Chitinophagaceae bacterium]